MAVPTNWLVALAGAFLMQSAAVFAHDDDDDDERRHRHPKHHKHYKHRAHHYHPRTVVIEREVVYERPAVVYEYASHDHGRFASVLFGAALGAYVGHGLASHR